MASGSGDHRTLSRQWTRLPEQEQFPCPRCESANTKFCYYNNYNLSQPRHFCKSCRRYWTRGGALRNVPVGGGTRKAHSSHKRPRISQPSPCAAQTSTAGSVSCSTEKEDSVQTNPSPGPLPGPTEEMKLNEAAGLPDFGRNPSSLLGGPVGTSDGLFPFNMYGVGLGYGLGMLEWPMEHMGGGNDAAVSESPDGDTWQLSGGGQNRGAADGDYFSWPELSIPAPAKALK